VLFGLLPLRRNNPIYLYFNWVGIYQPFLS